MKRFIGILSIILSSQASFGQGSAIIAQLNSRIDELQYELDEKDGVTDGYISSSVNQYAAQRAQNLYIDTVDRLQREITDKDQDWMATRNELRELKNWLVDTDPNRYLDKQYLDQFEVFYALKINDQGKLINMLGNDPYQAIWHYNSYKNQPYAETIIKMAYNKNANLMNTNASRLKESPYAQSRAAQANQQKQEEAIRREMIYQQELAKQQANLNQQRNQQVATQEQVERQVKLNPIKMKRWVGTNTPQGSMLEYSNDAAVKTFVTLFKQFGRASKSYYFLDDLLSGRITPEEAERIGNNEVEFRKKLMELSIRPGYILANEAIQEELEVQALKVIRPINDAHENYNYSARFRPVEHLSAEELYTYMVYTQEEIFTSTYNGFYERFMKKLNGKNPYQFLQEMNFNKYRTFIKMAAGYDKLNHFLSKMTPDERKLLLTKFVSNLEEGNVEESLDASVNVADTFGSINDTEMRKFFKGKMGSELARVNNEYNQHGIKIYSLLNGILAQSDNYTEDWINKLTSTYNIPKVNQLDYQTLVNHEGKVIQQVFFFDDDDGKASYRSFMPSFRNSGWTIKDKGTYAHIISSNKKVEIFANKPEAEFTGPEDISSAMAMRAIQPSVVIHRGHSFYVDTTIKRLTPTAKLVILGSCGGYHNLSEVLRKSSDVHIISSKQIGSMTVNDPMIRLLNKSLVNQKDIKWQPFWNTLGSQLRGNSKFKDYVPPHQNLGAIFIMAYNRMS